MSTVMPQQELLRRAMAYVDEIRRDCPGKPLGHILDEAGARFNLSPKDSQALLALFQEADAVRRNEDQA